MSGAVVTPELRRAVASTIDRLGPIRPVIGRNWVGLARACGIEGEPWSGAEIGDPAPLVVGEPAHLIELIESLDRTYEPATTVDSDRERSQTRGAGLGAAVGEGEGAPGQDRFGFVIKASVRPVSRLRRIQKPTRHLDPTLAIWRAGWAPLSLHRLEVERGRSLIGLVIGDAQRRPEPGGGPSALDDAN